jgi:CHAT domain-containing protein
VSGPVLASLFGGPPKAGREPLPHAAREVRWISRIFSDAGSDHLIGSDATVAEWMRHRPEDYRYLHFATHAHIDDREPNSTALAMADGGLDVLKIRQLSLRTELVTLSACETALGPRIRGEGIIGLPHAFLSAGARGVMVTLWRVPDESTAEFVRQFYQEIHDGASPSRALLSVRRRWIETRPPHEWAPFILIGGLPTPS